MRGWVPIAIVVLMAGASVEAFVRGNWRYGIFWLLDSALTGVSAFLLK